MRQAVVTLGHGWTAAPRVLLRVWQTERGTSVFAVHIVVCEGGLTWGTPTPTPTKDLTPTKDPKPPKPPRTPGAATAYVINIADDTVTPIDVTTNTAGSPIRVGHRPRRLAITPDGNTVYVSNRGDKTVTPISVATNTPGRRYVSVRDRGELPTARPHTWWTTRATM